MQPTIGRMKPAEQFSGTLALIFMRWPVRLARPHPALPRIRDRLIRSRFCQIEERRGARTGQRGAYWALRLAMEPWSVPYSPYSLFVLFQRESNAVVDL
jgi:hypothetical protein